LQIKRWRMKSRKIINYIKGSKIKKKKQSIKRMMVKKEIKKN